VDDKSTDNAQMYLDLLKKTLTFTLWPEPGTPIETHTHLKSIPRRLLVPTTVKVLKRMNLQLVRVNQSLPGDRNEGRTWPVYAETMIGLKRLDNLQSSIETVIRENIEGDLIETGAWRGGACIFMRAVLAAYGVRDRKVFVADSFEGLPRPDVEKYPIDKGDVHHTVPLLAVSQEQVENNFKKYGLLDEQVVFLKGWFHESLPRAPIGKLSILRLDGDMYGSTMDVLNILYPKLSRGGFCIIDDYHLEGCRKAVEDYRTKHDITTGVCPIDWSGVFWRKEAT